MNLEQENLAKEQIKKRERLARELFVKASMGILYFKEMKLCAENCFKAADVFLKVAEEERKDPPKSPVGGP